jgi:hypothetical protein
LLGAVTGYQSFSVIGNSNTTYYTIADQGGPNWEVGIGTWSTGGTLARTTVLSSSNAGSLVNFTTGTKDVFITQPSEKAVYEDASNNVTLPAGLTVANDASISGLTVGKGGGSQPNSTVFGTGAMAASNSGQSTAIGFNALAANTTGRNIAVGQYAMATNTTGTFNNTFGDSALYYNTTGGNNTAVGYSALLNNTTASNNTAVGYQAGYTQQTGGATTAVGYQAAYATNGSYGINAFGYQALYADTTGVANNAFGSQALANTTTGSYNTAMGHVALKANTTGGSNTAFGEEALQANTTASRNTAVGYQTLYTNTTGTYNVSVGYQAGYNATGNGGTFIGDTAGYSVSSGIWNTLIGQNAGYYITTGGKNTVIGNYSGNQGGLDIRTSSNYIVLSDGDGNPRQIIDSSGNVGIGLTPSAWESGAKVIQMSTSGAGGTSGSSAAFWARGDTLRIANGFYFNGANYIYTATGVAPTVFTQNALGNGVFGWQYAASGTAGGTFTFSEAMRIDSSGNLLVGTTSAGPQTTRLNLRYAGTDIWSVGPTSGSSTFYIATGTTGVFLTSTGTSWSSVSDERTKDIIEPITDAANKVSTLRAVIGKYKNDEEGIRRSFLIAQDIQKVLPEAVNVQNDEQGTLGIQYTDVIPLLVAAITELNAKLESQALEIATLKANK